MHSTPLLISLLLGIPAIILILCKCPKAAICCIVASLVIGFPPLVDLSIGEGYEEERVQFTLERISSEIKEGNSDIVVKVIDETEFNSWPTTKKNRYNIFGRLSEAKEQKGESANDSTKTFTQAYKATENKLRKKLRAFTFNGTAEAYRKAMFETFSAEECKILLGLKEHRKTKKEQDIYRSETGESEWKDAENYSQSILMSTLYIGVLREDPKWAIKDFFLNYYGVETLEKHGSDTEIDESWVPKYIVTQKGNMVSDPVFSYIREAWENKNFDQYVAWVKLCLKCHGQKPQR